MPKTKFTCPAVPGSQRTSARTYTHALVARENLEHQRALVTSASEMARYADFYDWSVSRVQAGVGGFTRGARFAVDQRGFDEASAITTAYPTLNAYSAHRIAEKLADIDKRGTGAVGELFVLQWSMSEVNAHKGITAARRAWYTDLHVEPVFPA